MKTWASRGSATQAKWVGMYCGKKNIHTANVAASSTPAAAQGRSPRGTGTNGVMCLSSWLRELYHAPCNSTAPPAVWTKEPLTDSAPARPVMSHSPGPPPPSAESARIDSVAPPPGGISSTSV